MAAAGVGVIGGNGCSWMNQLNNNKSSRKKRVMVSCVSSSASDPYKTLRIQRNASEDEVKKAFRQLALKYHPDVCKGSNCGDKFQKIYNAYDTVMTKLLTESIEPEIKEEMYEYTDIDMFEEWGGWEGAFRF